MIQLISVFSSKVPLKRVLGSYRSFRHQDFAENLEDCGALLDAFDNLQLSATFDHCGSRVNHTTTRQPYPLSPA
jgi:hypothetical protein